LNLIIVQNAEGDFAMIDIVVTDERKSRAEELKENYKSYYLDRQDNMVEYLKDISVTLGMIYDEMRGVKHE
jgi:hypothetical protein